MTAQTWETLFTAPNDMIVTISVVNLGNFHNGISFAYQWDDVVCPEDIFVLNARVESTSYRTFTVPVEAGLKVAASSEYDLVTVTAIGVNQ